MSKYLEEFVKECEKNNISDENLNKYKGKINKLDRLSKEQVVSSEYEWNQDVKEYVRKLGNVKKIFNSFELKEEISDLVKKINDFEIKCSDSKLNIALVGAIKAGKSALINALLNTDLASVNETPETASLTKFLSSGSDKNYIEIKFYTTSEWNELWESINNSGVSGNVFLSDYTSMKSENYKSEYLNKEDIKKEFTDMLELKKEVTKWTSSSSPTHYFVKEVKIGLANDIIPKNVIYVDTPGLDDVVEYRSNITRDYLSKADCVLLCIKSDSLRGDEYKTLTSVFSNVKHPEQVYVIGTQIDGANDILENWKKQKLEWTKYLKDDTAYREEKLVSTNLIGVSSYLQTLLYKYKNGLMKNNDFENIQLKIIMMKLGYDLEKLDDDMCLKLLEIANIENLRNTIKKNIILNKEKYLLDNIDNIYNILKNEIIERMTVLKNGEEDIINDSKKSTEEIEEKKIELQEKLNEYEKEKENSQIVIKDINNYIKEEINDVMKKIQES